MSATIGEKEGINVGIIVVGREEVIKWRVKFRGRVIAEGFYYPSSVRRVR